MGLRDLFRRKPPEDDWTAGLSQRGGGTPGPTPSVSPAPVPEHRATPVMDAGVSSISVRTTTIGPDGVPVTSATSGADVLASLPPQARRQLEALGLDGLITGAATADMTQAMGAWSQYAQGLGADGAAPAGAGAPDPVAQLKTLAELRDRGHVTEEEFAEQKRKLLDEI